MTMIFDILFWIGPLVAVAVAILQTVRLERERAKSLQARFCLFELIVRLREKPGMERLADQYFDRAKSIYESSPTVRQDTTQGDDDARPGRYPRG